MPTTINNNRDLAVKSADLGTASILLSYSQLNATRRQAHACYKLGCSHGMACTHKFRKNKLNENYVHLILCIQTSEFLNGPPLQAICDRYRHMNMIENHMKFLLPSKKKWDDILQLEWELLFLYLRQNQITHIYWKHATGLQSIAMYCCTCQSLNHDKSSSRIYFQTFIIMMIICTD